VITALSHRALFLAAGTVTFHWRVAATVVKICSLGPLGMHVLMNRRHISLYGESQFHSQLSQLVQLVNA